MKRRLLIAGMIVGGIMLFISPIAGALGAAGAVAQANVVLGDTGIADPRALASRIGLAILSSAAGLCLALAGGILCVVCLIFYLKLRQIRFSPPPLPKSVEKQIPS